MEQELARRTAIVTGAGEGVGRAVALRFAKAGANLMLADREDALLERTKADIDATGARARHFCCQIGERLSVANLLAATQEGFGRIDIVVNAGRRVSGGTFLDMTAEDFEQIHNETVRGVFELSQAAARRMIRQGEKDPEFRGAIVNVSSIAAQRAVPEMFGYSVACAALEQLTRSMAVSLAEHRIRVNAVSLGSVMTQTLRLALRERGKLRDEIVRGTPLGRIGEPDEAANAALYLASDQASFITGQILSVDGGRTLVDPLNSRAW